MKVKFIHDKNKEDNGMYAGIEIKINDKTEFSVSSGEVENNHIYENFHDCFLIDKLLQRAYNAGKNGEEFIIEYSEPEE